MNEKFNGLGLHLGNLSRLSSAKSRSICPENWTGEKGNAARATEGTGASAARDLGPGWKISPSVKIQGGETLTLADIEGPGAIQHIWMTLPQHQRYSILRFYWDGQEQPAVECPAGDFFANGWGNFYPVASLPVCLNPGTAYNCYWEMPFRRRCRITMTNIAEHEMVLYYQIDYSLTEVPEDAACFHAQFRRVNPLPCKEVYTILDGVRGRGHYVGTSLAWQVNNNGWWGEGEVKFYLDGDQEHPTICSTGTEDYFGGSYNFETGVAENNRRYCDFSTPYSGFYQVKNNTMYEAQKRFSMYRWHILDPVRFEQDLRVTIQALGWRFGGKYLPLRDDIASVAYWYQTLPTAAFPRLPDRDYLEII